MFMARLTCQLLLYYHKLIIFSQSVLTEILESEDESHTNAATSSEFPTSTPSASTATENVQVSI